MNTYVDTAGATAPTACPAGEYQPQTGQTSCIPVPAPEINVLFDQSKAKHAGSTLPVKLQLVDTSGINLSSPDIDGDGDQRRWRHWPPSHLG